VDVLFESIAATYADKAIGVILTGSGRDGAMGGRDINIAGGKLIAQNSATSVNFGMPTALMAATLVDCMLPLDEIAPLLLRWVPQN
jgi:two-component system chemotaxis response regulator CheB